MTADSGLFGSSQNIMCWTDDNIAGACILGEVNKKGNTESGPSDNVGTPFVNVEKCWLVSD